MKKSLIIVVSVALLLGSSQQVMGAPAVVPKVNPSVVKRSVVTWKARSLSIKMADWKKLHRFLKAKGDCNYEGSHTTARSTVWFSAKFMIVGGFIVVKDTTRLAYLVRVFNVEDIMNKCKTSRFRITGKSVGTPADGTYKILTMPGKIPANALPCKLTTDSKNYFFVNKSPPRGWDLVEVKKEFWRLYKIGRCKSRPKYTLPKAAGRLFTTSPFPPSFIPDYSRLIYVRAKPSKRK